MRQRPPGNDGGFTLIEVLVAAVLLTLVLSLTGSALVEFLREGTATNKRIDNLDQTRSAVDSMTRTLRTAVAPRQMLPGCTDADTADTLDSCSSAFVSASGERVVFFANLGDEPGAEPEPTKLTYEVVGNALTERRQKVTATAGGAYTFDACTRTCTRTLISDFRRTAGDAAMFSFRTLPAPDSPLEVAGVVAPALRGDIAVVALRLPVGSDEDTAAPDVTARILLPNAVLGS